MLIFVKRRILLCSSKECAFNNYLYNTTCGALYLQNIILPLCLCSHLAFITRDLLALFLLQTKDDITINSLSSVPGVSVELATLIYY